MRGVDVGDRDDFVNYATWWYEAQNRIELEELTPQRVRPLNESTQIFVNL